MIYTGETWRFSPHTSRLVNSERRCRESDHVQMALDELLALDEEYRQDLQRTQVFFVEKINSKVSEYGNMKWALHCVSWHFKYKSSLSLQILNLNQFLTDFHCTSSLKQMRVAQSDLASDLPSFFSISNFVWQEGQERSDCIFFCCFQICLAAVTSSIRIRLS